MPSTADKVYTINDVASSTFVMTAGNYTLGGTIAAANLSGTNSGDLTLAAVGAVPAPEGASLSGQILTLQPANASNPGLVTAAAQTLGGVKTFNNNIVANSNVVIATTVDAATGNLVFGAAPVLHTAGTRSVFLGETSGSGYPSLADNTCAGYATGSGLTTGIQNTLVGSSAGVGVTSGSNNTLLGYNAGALIGAGDNNVCAGINALSSAVDVYRNTAVGYQAGGSITGGNDNVIMGNSAGGTGSWGLTVAIGTSALGNAVGSLSNTAVGASSGLNLTTGQNNVSVGSQSGAYGAAQFTCALGSEATCGSGDNNVALGAFSGNLAMTGFGNIMVGTNAGQNLAGAENNNIYIGNSGVAAESNTTRIGTTQTAAIIKGIYGNSPASPQMVIVSSAGVMGSQAIVTGVSSMLAPAAAVNANGAVIAGTTLKMQFADATYPGIVSVAAQTFAGAKTFNNDIFANANVNIAATVDAATGNLSFDTVPVLHTIGTRSVFLGEEANTTYASTADNTCVGYRTGFAFTTAANDTLVGSGAGAGLTTGSDNTIAGVAAGAVLGIGSSNVAVGKNALVAAVDTSFNTAVGAGAGADLTTGTNNVVVGYGASGLTSNSNSCVIGYQARGGTGNFNTILGASAGTDIGANNNICIGYLAGSTMGNIGEGGGFGNIYIDNFGVESESNTIRIGTAQTATCIQGIYGAPILSPDMVVIKADGTMGSQAIPSGTVSTVVAPTAASDANGAIISGANFNLEFADATYPGIVSISAQTFAGAKTFTGAISASNFSGTSSGTNSGDVSFATAVTGSSVNAASLAGQVITLQVASASGPGVVSTGAQTFAGAKTFSGAITASNLTNTNSGDVTIGTIGAVPTANGATISPTQVLTLQPASTGFPGIVSTLAQSFDGAKTFNGAITASNLSGTNSGNVTIGTIGVVPTANGATIDPSTQVLTLQPASATQPGVVSNTTQSFLGVKTFTNDITGSANINLSATTSSTVGNILAGGNRFIHSFGTNNTFAGSTSGNYTLSGSGITAVGGNAGNAITSATSTTLVGYRAGELISSGINNHCFGTNCGRNISTGISNTCVGFRAGEFLTTGGTNVCVGIDAGAALTTTSGNIMIGTTGSVLDSNTTRIGNLQTSVFIPGVSGNTIIDTNFPQIVVADPSTGQLLGGLSFAYRNFTTSANVTVTGTAPTFTAYSLRTSGALTAVGNTFSTGSIIEVIKMAKMVFVRIPFFTITIGGGTHTNVLFTFPVALPTTAFAVGNEVTLSSGGAAVRVAGNAFLNVGATVLTLQRNPVANFTTTYGTNNSDVIFTYFSTT
jgi:hypothetical protein